MRVQRLLTSGLMALTGLVATGCPEDDLAKIPGDLRGKFCEPVSGEGIGRVEVALLNTDDSVVEGKSAVGDAAGLFEIKQIPPGEYRVRGQLGDLVRTIDVIIEPEKLTDFVDVGCHDPPPPPPPTGGIVRGRVCDDGVGAWVGFAQVWLSSPGNAGDVKYPGVTDVEGNFEIPNVAPAVYDLHISKDAFAHDVTDVVVAEGGTYEMPGPTTCEPPPGGIVEGQICEEGRGWVADARAYINLAGGNVIEDQTATDGAFSIPDVPPGVHVVRVEKDLFARSWQVTVTSGATTRVPGPATCDVPPPPLDTGTVIGRVCAPDGQTWLAGAQVWVGDEANPISQTSTDADGRFTLTGVPAGPQVVNVRKNSFSATYNVTVPANGTVTIPEEQCQVIPTVTRVAVINGRYDNVRCVLTGQTDPQASRPGDPCTAAGLGLDPANVTSINGEQNLWASQLLGNYASMQQYDIIFFNCGIEDNPITNGANAGIYAANLRSYVESGGSVYASDWAAPVIEQAFPEFVGWQGGTGTTEDVDSAKVGDPQEVTASVVDPGIRAALGRNSIQVNFDLPAWVAMKSTAPATRTYIRGSVEAIYGTQNLANIPLTVGFDVGQGRVVFTSFHQERNITDDMQQVLNLLVFEL